MATDDRLSKLRERIDALDEQIQTLINERASCAQEVANVKLAAGEDTHFYRPEREVAILRRVSERNTGPMPNEEMARLFREIMSACLALEKPLTIAYLGPEGTFTQSAALKQFGHSVETIPLDGIDDVFREVEAGAADYGVVPIENSTEGVVRHTLDLFQNSPLHVCGEVQLRVHHHLLSRDSDTPITKVMAHQQALAQCRAWLEVHFPHATHEAVASNADAARRVSNESGSAAIASETAAEIYGLTIRNRNIEDEPDNTTRFLVIGKQVALPSGDDLTSLLVSLRNKSGTLHQMLQHIARHGVSMTRIESRPSRQGLWEYLFYIDVEGHREDAAVAAALADPEKDSIAVKVLGSYPRAVI